MAKLKDFPGLQSFLQQHMTEGLYLLQFRKCEDDDCCKRKVRILPPKVPAPILNPSGEKYMAFDTTYGKITTTERDCPSINNNKPKNKDGPRYRLLSNRVASTILCHQCGKVRCVFSLNGSISSKGQREIEDAFFCCGMELKSGSIYTSTQLSCRSPIENAYYISRPANGKNVCYHCGGDHIMSVSFQQKKKMFKTVYPVCSLCKTNGKKEFCAIPLNKSKPSASDKSSNKSSASDKSSNKPSASAESSNKPSASAESNNKPSASAESSNKLSAFDESNNSDETKTEQRRSSRKNFGKRRPTSDEDEEGIEFRVSPSKPKKAGTMSAWLKPSDNQCSICFEDDPPNQRSNTVSWVDCDICHKWAHTLCANKGSWHKIYRNSWLCDVHKGATN